MFLDNFPQKFTPRETQKVVINQIEDAFKSDYKNILLCVPTGVGKSHIAVTAAKSLGTSFIITAQKILQDQYTNDFGFIYPMKGKSNFPCVYLYDESVSKIPYDIAKNDHDLTCDVGTCSWEVMEDGKKKTKQCKFKPKIESLSINNEYTEDEKVIIDSTMCHYYNQKYQSLLATHAIFNYSSYFQTKLYSQGIEECLERDCLIADEAHEIEDQIIGYIGLDIHPKLLESVKMNLNDFVTDTVDGVLELLELLGNAYTREINRLDAEENKKLAQKYRKRREKIDTTYYELKDNQNNFVIQNYKDTSDKIILVSIKPIEIGKYVGDFFDRPHQIFMSATINHQMFCRTMGIPEDDCKFIEVEKSPFPVENRKIVFHNIRKLNYRSTSNDYQAIFEKMKNIISSHLNEKGLILTTTKKQCQGIFDYLGDRIVIAHEGVEGKREAVLDYHKKTNKPSILVSPSLWYGVDLKNDLSRFQIICKAPYPSMADKRTKIKADLDPLWYQNKTVEKLLQGFGRSIRNDEDYAITYVLDEAVIQLLHRMKRFVPKAYYDSLGWE